MEKLTINPPTIKNRWFSMYRKKERLINNTHAIEIKSDTRNASFLGEAFFTAIIFYQAA